MNQFKFISLGLCVTLGIGTLQAQNIEQATQAIDAEQYEKAKKTLKAVIQANPADGRAAFLLGKTYLKQDVQDSAKMAFDRGMTAGKDANLNHIGLGELALNRGDKAAAESHFASATKDMRRRDTEEFVYVAQAYMDADNPNYKQAITVLERAKAIAPTDGQVLIALGDAYSGDKNQNDAYVAYRSAFQADNSLIRAQVRQGVLLKGARAFDQAVKSFEGVIATNPNYGPVYRELAETYYLWGSVEPRKYDEYIKKALNYYERYMSLTDYSLSSRMRRADFLILAKDYKALEVEANKMKEIDNVNPRILRYLGYAAYENGHPADAIKSLNEFVNKPGSKIIGRDYMYLGLAKVKMASGANATSVDTNLFAEGVNDLKKAVEMDSSLSFDLSELGKQFFDERMFAEAGAIYEVAVSNPESPSYLQDMFYYGYALYYANNREGGTVDVDAVKRAEEAFAIVAEKSPETQDAYLFRARANSLMEANEAMAQHYEQFISVVTSRGAAQTQDDATKRKLVEAYNNAGAFYAATGNKAKAREYFNQTLAIAPGDSFATQSLKGL